MRKLMILSVKYFYVVIILAIIITSFAGYGIRKIEIDSSSQSLILADDPEVADYKETIEKFDTDNITVIYIQDKNLFSPQKLKALEKLNNILERLPFVNRTESLFSVPTIEGEDNVIKFKTLITNIPETIEEALDIKNNALKNPLIINNLISKDGTATAINLFIAIDKADNNFPQEVTKKIDEILTRNKSNFETVFQLGNSYTKAKISENIIIDLINFISLSIWILIITVIIATRSIQSAILPLLTLTISIILTLGFMAYLKIPLNMLTIITPSLIILIGSMADIHMLSEFTEGIKFTGIKKKAVHFMAVRSATVVFFTAFTTCLIFLSIILNKITIIRQFCISSAFGLFIHPLITFTIGPVYLSFLGPSKISQSIGS
ncbi:MAG: MMPL family transporter, partial [Desulfobacterales bacterium]|nr:MMPL family transporter [Desulfobacterales bacterium]